MNIEKNSVVSIHYKLTDDEGTLVDSSEGMEPLTYLHGSGSIISGLESALEGKAAGDAFQVTVQPAEGYGDINPEMIQTVPRSAFKGIENLEPGMPLQADDGNGNVHHVTVREVNEQDVTIDVNHPLAGKVLHFDVMVESVREATPEEMAHGHAH
ncbi:MAG TPA: peptidylprolyl isomerase [Gammaproteobacteria bacterium]|nr:peptidylprolyl isomerase [Gammaproteobacteria bacterium]